MEIILYSNTSWQNTFTIIHCISSSKGGFNKNKKLFRKLTKKGPTFLVSEVLIRQIIVLLGPSLSKGGFLLVHLSTSLTYF